MLLSQAIELLQRIDFGVQKSNCIRSPKFLSKYEKYFFFDSRLFVMILNFYTLLKLSTFPT